MSLSGTRLIVTELDLFNIRKKKVGPIFRCELEI